MAQQTIDIGTVANDGTGDPIRDAFDKCNDNFTELYNGLAGLMDLKGSTDCSANPNYPAASKGDAYVVSVAGKIGGASGKVVNAGDVYFATADNAGGTEASVGTSWAVIEGNLGFTPVNKAGDTMTGDLIVPDEAYDATNWNGSFEVPTKNAVRDKIESVVAGSGSVSDAAYDASWDGDTTVAPSKNAVYDKIEALVAGGGGYAPGGTDVALADGGTGTSLSDPNVDSILFWDDSAGQVTWLTVGPGLQVIGTRLLPTVVGCRAVLNADINTANYTSATAIPFDGADLFDTNSFHDPSSNNTRITIPDLTGTYGVRAKKVTLNFTVSVSANNADTWLFAQILTNSAAVFNPGARITTEIGTTNPGVSVVVEDVVVVGDGTEYFEAWLQVESDTSITINSNRTSFSVKVTDWG